MVELVYNLAMLTIILSLEDFRTHSTCPQLMSRSECSGLVCSAGFKRAVCRDALVWKDAIVWAKDLFVLFTPTMCHHKYISACVRQIRNISLPDTCIQKCSVGHASCDMCVFFPTITNSCFHYWYIFHDCDQLIIGGQLWNCEWLWLSDEVSDRSSTTDALNVMWLRWSFPIGRSSSS